MYRNFLSILCCALAVIAGSALVSCNQELNADVFECSVTLESVAINHGEHFSFKVKTNHTSFSIRSYYCDDGWTPKAAGSGEVISCTPNTAVTLTTEEPVEITKYHMGKVSFVVKDTDTGAEKAFEGVYEAFPTMNLTMTLYGDKPTGKEVKPSWSGNYVYLEDGQAVHFLVEAHNFTKLHLTKVQLPFDATGLPGSVIPFVDGKWEKTFENVVLDKNVLFDKVTNKDLQTMLFTFEDEDTGRSQTVSSKYVAFKKFTPRLEILTDPVTEGEYFRFRIYTDRPSVSLTNYSGGVTVNAETGDGEQLVVGNTELSEFEVSSEGYIEFKSVNPVTVSSTTVERLSLKAVDTGYIGEGAYKILSAAYTMKVKDAPASIQTDVEKLSVKGGVAGYINIADQGSNIDQRYAVRILEEGKPVSATIDSSEPLKVRVLGSLNAYGQGCKATVRLSSVADPSVYKDIPVIVRHRAVLVLETDFKAYTYHDRFGDNDQGVWQGLPVERSTTATLCTWEGGESNNGPVRSSVMHALSEPSMNFSADFGFTGYPQVWNSDNQFAYLYGVNKASSLSWSKYYYKYGKKDWDDASGVYMDFILIGDNKDQKVSAYFSNYPIWTDGNFHSCERVSSLSLVNGYKLNDYNTWLRFYCDICQLQLVSPHLSSTWTSFIPDVRNITYNEEMVDFRGVVYNWYKNEDSLYPQSFQDANKWPEWNDEYKGKPNKPWFYAVDRRQWFVYYTK